MTGSINCWEFKECGEEDTCPAATFEAADGFLGGKNGGRSCVYVTGTFCNSSIQGTLKDKEKNCGQCDFYHNLKKEHRTEVSVIKFGQYIRESKIDQKTIEKYFIEA